MDYEPAWGKEATLKADAFVTGYAEFDKDLTLLHITFAYFGKGHLGDDDQDLVELHPFHIPVTPSMLSGIGRSYTTRGMSVRDVVAKVNGKQGTDQDQRKEVVSDAAKELSLSDDEMLKKLKGPLEIVIKYDGKAVQPYIAEKRYFLPEPEAKQKVTVEFIRRTTEHQDPFGIVLKINGINSLDEQKLPAANCRKWLVGTEWKDKPYEIKGFYNVNPDGGDSLGNKFEVKPLEESIKNEIKYGDDVGQISVTIFRSLDVRPPNKTDLAQQAETNEVTTPSLAQLPKQDSLSKAKEEVTKLSKRGLIEKGEADQIRIELAKFPNSERVGEFIFTYYLPHAPGKK